MRLKQKLLLLAGPAAGGLAGGLFGLVPGVFVGCGVGVVGGLAAALLAARPPVWDWELTGPRGDRVLISLETAHPPAVRAAARQVAQLGADGYRVDKSPEPAALTRALAEAEARRGQVP